MSKLRKYLFNLLVALDRGVNALLGGDPAMTLSGRMGKSVNDGHCGLCKFICKLLPSKHCAEAAVREANLGANEVLK